MSTLGLGLSYWLPCSEFRVDVTKRSIVETHENGSKLASVADVEVATAVVEDPSSRYSLFVEAGMLAVKTAAPEH